MNRSIFFGGIIFAFILGIAGAGALQETEEKKEGQESWTPPPPLEDEYLERFVGEWEYTGTMNFMGKPSEFTATETIEWILNHQFILGRYHQPSTEEGKADFEGISIMRSTPGTNQYQGWWFDVHAASDTTKGTRDGDSFSWEGEGPMGKMRGTSTVTKDGTSSGESETMWMGQTEWTPFMKVTGKRKAKE